jgi:hypothetical protein
MVAEGKLDVALLAILLGVASLAGLMWLVSTAGAAPRDAVSPCCCPEIIGDQFYVQGQRYLIEGLNYYEKDHAWDRFWPYWHVKENRATVEHELDIARDLGVNTLRIFLRWKHFAPLGPTVPLTAKQDLDDFLNLAAAKQMKVLITLFDGMPNEGSASLYITPAVGIAYLDSLFTPFTNTTGVTVDFSTDCRILAWDVKNEPDLDYRLDANGDGNPGTPEDREAVQNWVKEMIRHLRRKDSCHPITVGISGAVGGIYDSTIIGYYADIVDFLSVHYFLYEGNFPTVIDTVEALTGGKPIVVEEFGLHTQAGHPSDPHAERDQAAYYNAILSTVEADRLAGAMFWTLNDFSYIIATDEREKHLGILHNSSVTTTEVLTPADYSEKPAANVVWEHFRPFVAYLDTFDGYVAKGNCTPPLGWTDNYSGGNGGTIIACDPLSHTFAPSQLGRARLTKWAGPDGVITSSVLETVTVGLSRDSAVFSWPETTLPPRCGGESLRNPHRWGQNTLK